MSFDFEYSFHLFDEREFRERFLPAVLGNEDIVRELLDAANAAGPSWTALHKMFDEARVEWQKAAEQGDGERVQRTVFVAFARLLAHLRPAYCVRGFGLSTLDPAEFPRLSRLIRSPGLLLKDEDGRSLPGTVPGIADRVPRRALAGQSAGAFVPAEEVRGVLQSFREELPRLAARLPQLGFPAQEGMTVVLSALVEAKLQGKAIIEAADVLAGDPHLPKDHRLLFANPGDLPPAVAREVAKACGVEPPPGSKSEPELTPVAAAPGAGEAIDYTPSGSYEVGQRIRHKSFGQGEVIEVLDSRRIRARFAGEEKSLVQNLGQPSGRIAAPGP